MADGRVEFEISADGSKAYATIDQITAALQKSGKQWEQNAQESTSKIGGAFKDMFSALALQDILKSAGQALLNFGKEALSAASDLEEVQNVVDVTFGDNASVIENWAKKAGQQFGLTETQAKKFTSTLGAMKSAGLAGAEVATMSTDLSGLAADMASFYNLDFDTAFQKIRAGISGETEPLKQLGINMSVANLNAFALQQGLGKTFEQMSQGEQIMLRYQYIMAATSDAQGDFSRTSDGYANSLRMLETNIESIKAALGKQFIGVVTAATTELNKFIKLLMSDESKRTVLDEFNDIDLNTSEKIAAVEATADQARTLISVLREIETQAKTDQTEVGKIDSGLDVGEDSNIAKLESNIADISAAADAAKDAVAAIDDDAPVGDDSGIAKLEDNIGKISEAAGTAQTAVGGIDEKLKNTEGADLYKGAVDGIRDEIQGIPSDVISADGTFKDYATNRAGGISEYKSGVKGIRTEVSGISDDIFNTDAKFKDLAESRGGGLSLYKKGVQGVGDEVRGIEIGFGNADKKAQSIAENGDSGLSKYKTAVSDVASAAEGISSAIEQVAGATDPLTEAAGGLTEAIDPAAAAAEQVDENTRLWLATCQELVRTIPGLSSIINLETGEIEGGTEALEAYVTAWEETQKLGIMTSAHNRKQAALDAKFGDLPGLELDARTKEYRARKQRESIDAFYEKYGIVDENGVSLFNPNSPYTLGTEEKAAYRISNEDYNEMNRLILGFGELQSAANDARGAVISQTAAYEEAKQAWEEEGELLEQEAERLGQAAEERGEWSEATQQAAREAVQAFQEAAQAVQDYYDKAWASTRSQVESTVHGFSEMTSATDAYAQSLVNLEQQLRDGKISQEEYDAAVARGQFNLPTAKSMTDALRDQVAYMEEYQQDLEAARDRGVAEEVLASLADGSEESALYLHALAQASDQEVEEFNRAWMAAQEGTENFTTALTDQKLTVDETFQGMVTTAQEAAAGLNVSEQAKESAGANVQGIIDGIKEHVPDLQDQVDAVLAILSQLEGWGFTFNGISFGETPGAGENPTDGNFATGLDWVPFDGFLASLHEGEGILTAEENRVWQQFKNGTPNMDYDQLGSVMRDNVHAGGNVYLDGTTVGRVVSNIQGSAYKNLQRSGWQA